MYLRRLQLIEKLQMESQICIILELIRELHKGCVQIQRTAMRQSLSKLLYRF